MRRGVTCRLLVAVHAFAFAAVGGAMPSVEARTVVYVSNADSRDIYVLQLDPRNGDLTLVEKVPVAGAVMPLAVSPDRRSLYAALRSEPYSAASFSIDRTSGKLTFVASAPLPHSMAYLSTDRAGRYLLSASYPGHLLGVNPIGPQGAALAPQQTLATEPNAHCVLADPTNRFVLATSLGADLVMQFRFDAATGMLSPNRPAATRVKEKAGPRHLVFHPNGKLVYLLNELDGSIYAFDYDAAGGTLRQRQVASALPPGFGGKPWAADLHLTPDGRFLYASERTSSTLAAFGVEAKTGMLTPVGHYSTEQQPRGFNIDPSGRFLLAVGQLSHSMTSYGIDRDSGRLTSLDRHPMGQNPTWVEIIELP